MEANPLFKLLGKRMPRYGVLMCVRPIQREGNTTISDSP